MEEFFRQFLDALSQTGWLEGIAVVSGIASVWLARQENILVYPVGLVNTIFYVYLSFSGALFGEAAVNLYYTLMSIYGWIIWSKKDQRKEYILHITESSMKQWIGQLIFFGVFFVAIYFALVYLREAFSAQTIPLADALASATAFTGMWLMAKKKVESWYWWIATNIISVPLFYTKGYALTSVYYFILLIMAFFGLQEWNRKARTTRLTDLRTFIISGLLFIVSGSY
jgi:nicotinamide mononucleotide transporter